MLLEKTTRPFEQTPQPHQPFQTHPSKIRFRRERLGGESLQKVMLQNSCNLSFQKLETWLAICNMFGCKNAECCVGCLKPLVAEECNFGHPTAPPYEFGGPCSGLQRVLLHVLQSSTALLVQP